MTRPDCRDPRCDRPADVVFTTPDGPDFLCALHALEYRVGLAIGGREVWPVDLAERVCTRLALDPQIRSWLITSPKGVAA